MTGFAQHPLVDRSDQTRLFGQRNENARGHGSALWMVPAHQRLESEDGAVSRGLRLEMEFQFVSLDRHCEVAMQQAAVSDLVIHGGFEESDRSAAFRLGAIQRGVGMGDQCLGVEAILRINADSGGTTDP